MAMGMVLELKTYILLYIHVAFICHLQHTLSVNLDKNWPSDKAIVERLYAKEVRPLSRSYNYLQYEGHRTGRTIFYKVKTFGKSFILILTPDSDFISPNFHVELVVNNSHRLNYHIDDIRNCFYSGEIEGEQKSMVTVNNCNGLQGAFRSSHGEFLIRPTETTENADQANGFPSEHMAYKIPGEGNDRGHNISIDGVDYSGSSARQKFTAAGKTNIFDNYMPKGRSRRSVSWNRYVETMVVADESMYEFYGQKELELRRYLLSVMATVRSIFKDSSVGNSIEIAIVKLVILKKNPPGLKVSTSASRTLKNFCAWQAVVNKASSKHARSIDTAVLVTRKDLCTRSVKCVALGLAELGTICDKKRSCSVAEDNGLSLAFTIAHELGHLFSAPHDGDHNDCTKESGNVHLMTPSFTLNSKTHTWSTCSRKYITEFLEAGHGSCLFNKPSRNLEYHLPRKLPGLMFSSDEQCKLVFGKKSVTCPYFKTCQRLWCLKDKRKAKSCHTNNMPWAEGTSCGKYRWCVRGECVTRTKLRPINGQWGAWGSYGDCSRTCGGGITFSTRECDNPSPQNSGRYCIGMRRRHRSCNTHECPPGSKDFRAIQCEKFNGRDLGIHGIPAYVRWKPKYRGVGKRDQCKLYCEVEGSSLYYELASRVVDGTPCKPGAYDICVEGKCRPAGCDHVINSKKRYDKCGVCNGDNSTCRTYTRSINKTGNLDYNFIAHIPISASDFRIVQTSITNGPDTNFLALVNQKKKRFIFNGNYLISLGERTYTNYGQEIIYSGSDTKMETVRIPGRVRSPITVYLLRVAKLMPVNITYSFNIPIKGKQNYSWVQDHEWSECTHICQGIQTREYRCLRDLDSQQVSDKKCIGQKPSPEMMKCNRHCVFRWDVELAQECSAKCGNGRRVQKAFCQKKFGNSSIEPQIVNNKFCSGMKKPPKYIACFSACTTTRWFYSDWSKCSKDCNGGIQTRKAFCIDQNLQKLPFKECDKSQMGPLEQSCNNIGCPQWKTGEWNLCSVTCGKGAQYREVYCVDGLLAIVKNSYCNVTLKPESTRPCELLACPSWVYGTWSKCSVTCNTGYKTRKVGCRRSDGQLIDDQECDAHIRPNDREECKLKPCPANAQAAQQDQAKRGETTWMTGAWTECSKSCANGFQERYVSCRYATNGEEAPEKTCDIDKKPIEKRFCNDHMCPVWQTGEWSKCTALCGGGTRTRLVRCLDHNERIRDENVCSRDKKPNERQSCNQHKCATPVIPSTIPATTASGIWKVGSWSECSVTCGDGVRRRSVTCESPYNSTCKLPDKPRDVERCGAGHCPGWNYGRWSECSKSCGEGVMTRSVFCRYEDGRTVYDSACDSRYKPVNKRSCTRQRCPDISKWVTGPWQPCSATCGKGFQFREIICENKQGQQMPESKCQKETKPSQQKACDFPVCPHWITSQWNECNSTCHKTREVFCARGEEVVDTQLCSLQSRPVEAMDCGDENCIRPPTYTWKIGNWGQCSKTCGYSVRVRDVTCVDDRNIQVAKSYCAASSTAPKRQQACFAGPCPGKWLTGLWSECSVTCGVGVQRREIVCEGMLKKRIYHGGCPSANRPAAWQICNMGECQDLFRWKAGNWTKCSKPCEIGVSRREVFCIDERNNTQPDEKCLSRQPANFRACNTHACPPKSCREVQIQLGVHFDGEHEIMTKDGKKLKVYCEGMERTDPLEYITLRADPVENYSEIYGKRLKRRKLCPNNGTRLRYCDGCLDFSASGTSYFSKIRIDIIKMVILTDDKKFAVKFGRNPPPYASAGDCYSQANCPQGRFRVNLEGTGLSVDYAVRWKSRGYHHSKYIQRLSDGKVINGRCGGYCGMCSPLRPLGLKVNVIES